MSSASCRRAAEQPVPRVQSSPSDTPICLAEHGGAHFAVQQRLQLLAQRVTDAAEADRVRAVGHTALDRHRAAARLGTLADADQAVAAAPFAFAADRSHRFDRIVDLGQQDDVGGAGQTGLERDPARVAAHGLDDHDAAVALAGGLQPLDRCGHGGDRGVEAEAALAADDVVVYGLGHADDRQSALAQTVRDRHRAVAADGHQRIEPERARAGQGLRRSRLVAQRIGLVAGAQHGAALHQDAADAVPVERPGLWRRTHQAGEAVADADHLGAALAQQRLGDRADHRVESGAVAAAGEHAYAHLGLPVLVPVRADVTGCAATVPTARAAA